MQNPDAVNNVIDHLAAKLSIPASQLWSVLIKQTYVDGIFSCFMVLVICITLFFGNKWYKKLEWIDEEMVPKTFMIIAGIILTVIGFSEVYNVIVNFINPQYAALQELMSMIVKK